jgi:phospholipase/carboxylesterase
MSPIISTTRLEKASMIKISNGASLKPLSGGPPKQIVLLLHGFGSNGADMIEFAPSWQQRLPDALFLAPHAPHRVNFGTGYQWWGLSNLSPQALAAGATQAAPIIDEFIDRKLRQYELTEAEMALVGFSQGTMMALEVGLRRPRQLAAIVGYSGLLTGGEKLSQSAITKPPVLLVHDRDDPVVPFAALNAAETRLRELGLPVSTHISVGFGHRVDPDSLKIGCDFVRQALGLK